MNEAGSTSFSPNLLVIGYGNELRSDDGVGPKIAAAIAAKNVPGIRAIACHQLTPELADPVSKAAGVVFVDAAIGVGAEVSLRQIAPAEMSQAMTHVTDPKSLLGLARDVFGRFPPAWWLRVPVENMGFGEQLSPLAERGFALAIEKIIEIKIS